MRSRLGGDVSLCFGDEGLREVAVVVMVGEEKGERLAAAGQTAMQGS